MEKKSGLQWFADGYKQYASFKGRSRRKAYWYFTLFNVLLLFAGISLISAISPEAGVIFYFVWIFASFLPSLAVGVRRMHDAGKSGWFLLIPIYGFILTLTDSEPGTNNWGPNPKNPALDTTDHLVDLV